MDLMNAMAELSEELASLRFRPPVTHVYNPLVYARSLVDQYLTRFARPSCEVLLLGMNPGPWGMAQTGVPFGEVNIVRDWLQLDGKVDKPAIEHPKRPVQGLECPRSEVSGARLWGLARKAFKTPERFFERFFIANYCPLCFMEETGRNRTPDKLPTEEAEPLLDACDRALRRTVEFLNPSHVIGVGAFAEKRACAALPDTHAKIGRILHPSPASPAANRGWAEKALEQLAAYGIDASGDQGSVAQSAE